MDIYGKLEKSRVLSIIERLQISNILEIMIHNSDIHVSTPSYMNHLAAY
jgi:hypothetical protein